MKPLRIIIPAAALLAGTIFGGTVTAVVLNRRKSIGTLRFDTSDPDEEPYMFLELNKNNVPAIMGQRYVVLKVSTENYLPRK